MKFVSIDRIGTRLGVGRKSRWSKSKNLQRHHHQRLRLGNRPKTMDRPCFLRRSTRHSRGHATSPSVATEDRLRDERRRHERFGRTAAVRLRPSGKQTGLFILTRGQSLLFSETARLLALDSQPPVHRSADHRVEDGQSNIDSVGRSRRGCRSGQDRQRSSASTCGSCSGSTRCPA